MEVTDSSFIQSSTGYTATIAYSGRGYVSGKAHTFKAHLTDAAGKNVLTAEGQWDSQSTSAYSLLPASGTVVLISSAYLLALPLQSSPSSRRARTLPTRRR